VSGATTLPFCLLLQDRATVEAALSSEQSNGQVEGQVNRLKFVKRLMYRRGRGDMLTARVSHRTQEKESLNHFIASLLDFVTLEGCRYRLALNHFALKGKLCQAALAGCEQL
jgi:hypothetical protein